MNESEMIRIEEAKSCTGCPEWLKHCNAECCRIVQIITNPKRMEESGDYLEIHKFMTQDKIWYYKLRGVKYVHGILLFPKAHCYPIKDGIFYKRDCDKLTSEFLCSGHPNSKPEFCKSLTLENVHSPNIFLTPNCLFRYKTMEVKDDDKNNEDEKERTRTTQ